MTKGLQVRMYASLIATLRRIADPIGSVCGRIRIVPGEAANDDAEFESKHPRARNGEFAHGSGSTGNTHDKPYNPRTSIPKVRGGWSEKKILSYLKSKPTLATDRSFARLASEFDTVDDFKKHLFYHGTSSGSREMQPSMCFSQKWAERNGGGGYGERYWGISVSKDKKIASRFSQSSGVSVYPVLLSKSAKVIDEPTKSDANEIAEDIAKYWNEGVDAIRLGDWSKEFSEKELLILNPRAVAVGPSEYYRYYQLGSESNPLRIPSDEKIKEVIDGAKAFMKVRKPSKPSRLGEGLNFKPADQYASEVSAYENSEEKKKYDASSAEFSQKLRL